MNIIPTGTTEKGAVRHYRVDEPGTAGHAVRLRSAPGGNHAVIADVLRPTGWVEILRDDPEARHAETDIGFISNVLAPIMGWDK